MKQTASADGSMSTGRLVLLFGIAGFASALSMRPLDPVVPQVATEFGRSIAETAALSAYFSIFYALGQPILGPLGDAYGKARLITLSIFGLAVALVATALATNFPLMIAARAFAGFCAGGIIPLCMASLGDRVPIEQRQLALARFMTAVLGGQILSSTFAGIIAHFIGWRPVFFMVAGLVTAVAVIIFLTLNPRKKAERTRLSIASALAGYGTVLANPKALPLFGLAVFEGSAALGVFPFVAGIFEERSGAGPSEAGIALSTFAVGGLCYAIFAGRIISGLGQKRMAMIGGLIMACGYLVFSLPFLPWWSGLGIFLALGFGFYFIHSTFQTQATELSTSHRGSALALFAFSLFLGNAIGPLLMGFLSSFLGHDWALVVFAAYILGIGLATPRFLGLR